MKPWMMAVICTIMYDRTIMTTVEAEESYANKRKGLQKAFNKGRSLAKEQIGIGRPISY